MIPNNPDINDLFNIINKKRKQNKEVNVDLQILCLKKLENMFKDKKLSAREISKRLNDLEYTMNLVNVSLENNNNNVLFISLLNIFIKEIVDIRKMMIQEGRQFNILNYIKIKQKN